MQLPSAIFGLRLWRLVILIIYISPLILNLRLRLWLRLFVFLLLRRRSVGGRWSPALRSYVAAEVKEHVCCCGIDVRGWDVAGARIIELQPPT